MAVFDEQIGQSSGSQIEAQFIEFVLDQIRSLRCVEVLLGRSCSRNDMINRITKRRHVARDECELHALESAIAIAFALQKLNRDRFGVGVVQRKIRDTCVRKANVSLSQVGARPAERIKHDHRNTCAPRVNLGGEATRARLDQFIRDPS